MNARFAPVALLAFVAMTAVASAQPAPAATPATGVLTAGSNLQPQSAPNAGAAEANPSSVKGPGGYTTQPARAPRSQNAPASYGGDPNGSGNDFTASPPLGPQQNLGQRLNRTVHYVAGNYIAPPLIYNAYAGPGKGNRYRSFAGRAAFELPLGQYDVYVGGEARTYEYPTRGGQVNGLRAQGSGFVPSFTAHEYDEDLRAGIKIIGPRIFGAVSYLTRGGNLEGRQHGAGVGIEKLADVDQNFSLHGNLFFYPHVNGQYSINGAGSFGVAYREIRYLIGASIQPNHSPVFLDAGYLGDRGTPRTDAPIGFNHQGPYLGLGIHF